MLLIIGIPMMSFAQDNHFEVTSDSKDILLDGSEVVQILSDISDPVKKELLTEYCFKPLYWEVNTYLSKQSYLDKIDEILVERAAKLEKIRSLSNSSVEVIQLEINNTIDNCIKRVSTHDNMYISTELFQYIQETMPEYIEQIKNKVIKEDVNLNAEIDISQYSKGLDNSTKSIYSKYYSRSLELYANIGVILIGTCEVNWTYDSSTGIIQSLYPNTTFVYDPFPVSTFVFTTWPKSEQFLSYDKKRGYVQKARMIETFGATGSSVPVTKMVWNLVFSPIASDPNKTLYEQVQKLPPTAIVNWGGGY